MDLPRSVNDLWFVGFCKAFELQGKLCYTLLVVDLFTREVLAYQPMGRPNSARVSSVMENVFLRYGLPEGILTHKRGPFYSSRQGSLSALDVLWTKLGICIKRIEPADSEIGDDIESIKKWMREQTARPYVTSIKEQEARNAAFLSQASEALVKPRASHAQKKLQISKADYTKLLNGPLLPAFSRVEKVYPNGVISFEGVQFYVGQNLKGEFVSLSKAGSDEWEIFFGHIKIGKLKTSDGEKRRYRKFAKVVRSSPAEFSEANR